MPPMRGAGGGKTVLWRTSSTTYNRPGGPVPRAAVLYTPQTALGGMRAQCGDSHAATLHSALIWEA